jgi:hypothetical protein
MPTEYLLKSDVMAAIDWNRWAAEKLNKLQTFPDPSLAGDDKPLKLEAGKLYRTRDGRKAFVSNIDDKGCATLIEGISNLNFMWRDGSLDKDGEHPYDLISLWDEPAPESGNSKLLEMIAKAEWLNVKVVNPKELAMNVCFIRDSIAEVCNSMREIARLLAERGDK